MQVTEGIRLSASDLVCVRGGREVFRDVNFSLTSGQALAVTGQNGAGKSSLLRMVAGLLRAAAGDMRLEGGTPEREIAEHAHYLGHQDALKSSLSVDENLSFWIQYLGGSGEPHTALATVGLQSLSRLPAAYLSAGQRRRMSLARLVAIARPLWLLDEPTSALDAVAQDMLLELMRKHLAAGGLIVAATHAPLDLPDIHELRLGSA